MGYRTWSDADLISAVKSSTTKAEVIRKLGLSSKNSGNFQTIAKHILRMRLDTDHFKEAAVDPPIKRWNLEDILIKDSPYTSTKNLKRKLIKNGLLEEKCYVGGCGINEWLGKKLSLQLDHINGDNIDNRIENLRLLCPNCHSLTETFCRGKSPKKDYRCPDCNVKVKKQFARCKTCAGLVRRNVKSKIVWPEIEILKSLVNEFGYVQTGRKLGVSDNAIRKRLKILNERSK